MNDNVEQERKRLYENFHKDAMDRAKSNQEAQDKMILTISVALFGILPFILEKLQLTCFNTILVVILLLCNTICLVAVMLSFWLCAKGNIEDVKFADEYFINGKEEFYNKQSEWTQYGEKCNKISLIFIVIVFIILAIILGNYFINKEYQMSDKTSQTNPIMNGFATQKMQKLQDDATSATTLNLSVEGATTQQMISINQPQQTIQQPCPNQPNLSPAPNTNTNTADTDTKQNK